MARGNSPNNATNANAVPVQNSINLHPALDQLSIYYIHPGENPCSPLVSPLLSSQNYHNWARGMKRALILKNKFRFVNGSLPMPTDFDPSFDSWERCNNLVLAWIFNSVEPQIAKSIASTENVVVAWNVLRQRFSQSDRVRIYELQQELSSLKQDSLSVTDYFTEMTTLWDDISSFRPLPACSCPVKCNCLASRAGNQYRREDYVMRFLGGLNEEYDVVRTQILMMDTFPDIDKVFSLVMQHERRISPLVEEDPSGFVNAVESRKPYGRGKGNSKICTHCGKTGHTENVCYKKYGFPDASKGKNASSAHNIAGESSGSVDDDQSSVKADSDQPPSLTQEQYKTLIALLQHSNLSNSSTQNTATALTTRTYDSSSSAAGFEQFEDDWFC